MASKLLRRSGVAVVKIAYLLEWEPDSILQVGIGGMAEEVPVMKELWPNARLVGFEPHPKIVSGLSKHYPGEIYQYAIADKPGRLKMYHRPNHKDGTSLFAYPPSDKGQSELWVDVENLDRIFPDPKMLGERILLWMDCEGGEYLALRGAEKFVEGVDLINIEMTGNPPNPEWGNPVDIHFWLLDHNFKRLTTHTTRSDHGQYDAIYVKPHLFKPELCCCPCMMRDTR